MSFNQSRSVMYNINMYIDKVAHLMWSCSVSLTLGLFPEAVDLL